MKDLNKINQFLWKTFMKNFRAAILKESFVTDPNSMVVDDLYIQKPNEGEEDERARNFRWTN